VSSDGRTPSPALRFNGWQHEAIDPTPQRRTSHETSRSGLHNVVCGLLALMMVVTGEEQAIAGAGAPNIAEKWEGTWMYRLGKCKAVC
jgi:hypothetical protein